MIITWQGQRCFKIESSGKTLLISPADADKILRSARVGADIVIFESRLNQIKTETKADFFGIDGPGEYDIKDFCITGLNNQQAAVPYIIEAEGIKLCHLPYATFEKDIGEDTLTDLGEIDILLISAGSTATESARAVKIANQLEPRIVLPMDFDSTKKPSNFLKELGASDTESQPKLTIKKKDLPQEEIKVILLNF